MNILKILFGLIAIAWMFSSCTGKTEIEIAEKRVLRAQANEGDILIGVAWPFSKTSDLFREGVELAIEEVNEKGGLLGKRFLRAIIEDDGDSVEQGRKVAKDFANNLDMVAVIGHQEADVTIANAIIYQNWGLLFLSPGATDPTYTNIGFDSVFRTIPSDRLRSRLLVNYFKFAEFKEIVVLSDDSEYGMGFSRLVHIHSNAAGVNVVYKDTYELGADNFRKIIAQFANKSFDAIFVAGHLPDMGILIQQTREMGVSQPFIGGQKLNSPELWKIAGKAADETIVTSVYDPNDQNEINADFVSRFREKYGKDPDVWAAQGFDAVKLLAFNIEKGKSTILDTMVYMIRNTKDWLGVTGYYSFKKNGDLMGKNIYFNVLNDGKFDFLAYSIHPSLIVWDD